MCERRLSHKWICNPIFVLDALRYGKSPDGSLLCCSIGIEPPRLPYGRAANYGSIIIPVQVRRCADCNPAFWGWHESLFLFGKSRRAARIAPCTGMYLVNDIQFSRFRLWLFTCVLYRVQRTSNRDWLCYFADTNSASSACRVVTDCMIGAKQITAVPFREVSACRPHSSLHGNVPGEWYAVFKISVMGFSYLHIVPSPKSFQQGLVVLLLLHNWHK